MHGRVQLEGWSCRSLRRTGSQHMRPALPLVTTENRVDVQGESHSSPASSVTTTATDSFFKDGRKISVGDCALFKPPQDSPPFIGLIRWFATSNDNILVLGVNWLYRPAEIKLGKGIVVEGAPNEIFYSFHKDKIPVASLLHPCKVAFLPRGVELPAGTSSFVCRRVYDIANKCLWCLTDQDYINECQEEVDQLLHKTKEEMHATLQSDGRSPKQVNGPTSTSQLKPASDSGQNSGSPSHSQVKGKKRERGDHGADPIKRERSLRSDDVDSFQCKIDYNLKSEISRITEKGGLTELEGVEKLVQLMHPDRSERKLDLISRSMLAGVVAATDNADCLNWFVQFKGLPVLDEWLQDIHKGKIGDNNGLKESDKSVEEFLLVLLCALDKLPVNLQALQMCNIGRSVNHLRSNKNLDIQKKARSLVDTWKKRVEAEMISIDAKAASSHGTSVWSSKSRLPDSSHGGSRTPSASDVAMKSSLTQNSASKTTSGRSPHGETNTKSATSSPGHVKSASSPSSGKETLPRVSAGGTPDAPLVREDRNSSSNQSHIYIQSLPVKDDGKSSVSVPVVNKSSSSTRNRKNSSLPGTSLTGSQKEFSSSRISSAYKCTALEKLSQSLSSEKVHEGTVAEGSSHKLIVKIPNRVYSPAGVAGGSLEDSAYMSSRVSSPLLTEKQEQFDGISEDKSDTYQCNVGSDTNVDSWKNDDLKDVLTGSVEGATSPAARPDEERSMTTEDSVRLSEATAPTNQLKPGKWHGTSFSPMNALIESCVKYSEANTLSMEDDVGMKLLASVATGEMSRSDLVSPADSTEPSTPAVQEAGCSDEAKSKSSPENNVVPAQVQSSNDAQTSDQKQPVLDGGSQSDDVLHSPKHAPLGFFSDRNCDLRISEEVSVGENNKNFDPSNMDVGGKADIRLGSGDKSNKKSSTSLGLPTDADTMRDGDSNEGIEGVKQISSYVGTGGVANCKSGGSDVMAIEEKVISDPLDGDKKIKEDVTSDQSPHAKQKNDTNGLDTSSWHKCASEFAEQANSEKLQRSASGQKLGSGICNKDSSAVPNENGAMKFVVKSELKSEMEVDGNATGEVHTLAGYTANELKNHQEGSVEDKVIREHVSVPQRVGPSEPELQKDNLKGTKSDFNQPNELDGHASTCTGASSVTADADAKVKFDLNEGVVADEGKYGEPVNLMSSAAETVHMVNSLAFSANSTPSGHAASITIAAAAKGPFVPPKDLLRGRGELGWKGSAATSAFRPAEPRKALEAQFGSTNMPCPDTSTSKPIRMPLDIDLNVPDERVLEEMAPQISALVVDSKTDFRSARATLPNEGLGSMPVRCSSSGLDFDLNRVDEACDNGNCSTSSNYKVLGSFVNFKSVGAMPSNDVRRDFDLNDGPGVDDTCAEPFSINQQVKGIVAPQLLSAGLRMNPAGQGSFSSWFPAGNTYSTIAVPSMLPDRGEHQISVFPPTAPQRTFGPSEVTAFTPDVYRGSVLPSSPAVPFPSSSFPYPVFPFGTTFPLPSATFSVGAASYPEPSPGPRLFAPPVHSQLLGQVGSVSSQFQRPYMVNLTESSSQVFENSRKWSRHGLDLNAGPGAVEGEAREEMFSLSSSQHSVASSQALAGEQARMYSVTSGLMKRKEPEGGWENESFGYKQSSWQ